MLRLRGEGRFALLAASLSMTQESGGQAELRRLNLRTASGASASSNLPHLNQFSIFVYQSSSSNLWLINL
jgi:hypothetical protein